MTRTVAGRTGRSGERGSPGSKRTRRFVTTAMVDDQARTHVPVPFDPDETGGPKARHHVIESLGGCGLRGVIDAAPTGPRARTRPGVGTSTADRAARAVSRSSSSPKVPSARIGARHRRRPDAAPAAGAFFDSLAQFYRDAYLRWIDATERRPEQRPLRIAEMIRLLGRARRNAPVEQSAQAVRSAPVVVLLGLDPRDPQMRRSARTGLARSSGGDGPARRSPSARRRSSPDQNSERSAP